MQPPDLKSVMAVVPMAGRGTRLGASTSKEIVSLGSGRVLADVMLARLADSGVSEAVLAVSADKTDIREHFGERFTSAANNSLELRYVDASNSPSTPFSVAACCAESQDRICALGFADILYQPCPGYVRALSTLQRSVADVVLGLFPTTQTSATDMVGFEPDGGLREILIKRPEGSRYAFTWSIAVWRGSFSEFLQDFVRTNMASDREIFVGDVILAAREAGLKIGTTVVSTLPSLDAGTPQALREARAEHWL